MAIIKTELYIVDELITRHHTFTQSININLTNDFDGFYWIPQLHKNLNGHLFIAAFHPNLFYNYYSVLALATNVMSP